MFATELVLAQEAETFGARKQRKARQQSVTGSSINTSIGSQSSTSSESTEREQWWSQSLKKKAKSIKPKILRPSTSKSTASQKTINAVTQNLDSQLALHFKDPALQPSWTYTSSLSSTLPSGDSLHSRDQVPDLDGDISSRRTDSTRSRVSRKSSTIARCSSCAEHIWQMTEGKCIRLLPSTAEMIPSRPLP